MKTIDPATGRLLKEYAALDEREVAQRIMRANATFLHWKEQRFSDRSAPMRTMAELLRQRKAALAGLMADEMGKMLKEGIAEIEKCAAACEYYAAHAEAMLRDETITTEARHSFVTYQPLGPVLAIMPWNFPFWQVFRFAVPNLMAGNVALLKHASNVCGCALEIETLFRDAGFPDGCFSTLLIPSAMVEKVIEHPHVRAVTLTGSTEAGRAVAAKAGAALKKTVLELGGSDPYVILEDADVKAAAAICAQSRLINAGQSCIAAKRFIVISGVKQAFEKYFAEHFESVAMGSPKDEHVDIGPLARHDLRDALHAQVEHSVSLGAKVRLGGRIPQGGGAYYPPTVLTDVRPGMPAFNEELFGPVAAIIEAVDEEEAFLLASATQFGLGSAIFTSDLARAETLARTAIDAGQTFVNALVKSDQRLPFGGVKESGYGRELGMPGIREFMNAKTVYIA